MNDTVCVRNYNVSGKWVPGIIVSRTGPVSYVVQVSRGKVRHHFDQLCKRLDEFDADTVMVPESEGSETSAQASNACHGPVLEPCTAGHSVCSTDSPQASQDLLVQPRASVPASPITPTAHTSQSSAEPGDPGQMDRPLRRSQRSRKGPEYLADFELG